MKLTHYKSLIEKEPTKTLLACLNNPNDHMRSIHIRIIQAEIKKRYSFAAHWKLLIH